MIVTANHHFGLAAQPVDAEGWKALAARSAIRRGIHLEPAIAGAKPMRPRVNHGAWIMGCPNPDCGGAEYVWEDGLFMCWSCFNAHVHHRYLHTSFPRGRRTIEAILDLRPEPNRNWEAPESLADLQIENIEHDLPVPSEVR